VGEIALLSVRRPLLALLLAIASITIFSTRLVDPISLAILSESKTTAQRDHTKDVIATQASPQTWHDKPRWRNIICYLEYAVLLGAIANTITNSWQLGNNTVVVWKCNVPFLPLIWTLSPGLFHFVITIPFRYSNMAKAIRCDHKKTQLESKSAIWIWLYREFCISTPVSQHALTAATLSPWSSAFLKIAVLCGVIHFLLGIAIFSSLLFVSVLDALLIIIRYGISAAVCYLILAFELYSMQPESLARV
jgi:hypothetical protein